MNATLRAAIALVRAWTRIYTAGLPIAVREARREEIAVDVWESVHDPDRDPQRKLALRIALRLLLGIPDDLRWRADQPKVTARASAQAAIAIGAVCGLVLTIVVVAPALWWSESPALPRPPAIRPTGMPRAPAPPSAPSASGRFARASSQRTVDPIYGQTSYTVTPDTAAPRKIKDVRPVYPPIALSYDVQGVVVIQARITDDGRVVDTRVVQSAGFLDHPALDAVKQWEFAPSAPGSSPAQKVLTATVTFTQRE
jgi:TonB family protein